MDDSSGAHYVFVTLLGTGMPWSESETDVSFRSWACSCFDVDANEFSWMECPGDQNMEFTTALPTRAGINPLVKPRAALSRDYPTEKLRPASCGRLSLRNVKARHGLSPILYPTELTNLNKIWVAQRVSRPLQIEAVNRMSFFRSHPNKLFDVFPSEAPDIERNVMEASKKVLEWAKAELRRRLAEAATKTEKTGLNQAGVYLNALLDIVRWSRPAPYTVGSIRSTHWNPAIRQRIVVPKDIIRGKCVCAGLGSFGDYLAEDCRNLGMLNMSPNTVFDSVSDIIPVLFHTCKGHLMSWLRTAPVSKRDVLRVMVYEEARETLRVSGSVEPWLPTDPNLEPPSHQNNSTTDIGDQTHKHRVLWLCPQEAVARALNAASSTVKRQRSRSDQHVQHCSLGEAATALWKEGSLHILVSAPRLRFAHRMTIFPRVPTQATSSVSCSRGSAIKYTHTKRHEKRQPRLMIWALGFCASASP